LGNVLSVFAADKDANGNILPAGSVYVSGTVISGVCGSGLSFFDKPFSTRKGWSPMRRHGRRRHRWNMTKNMPEFQQEIQNREQQISPLRLMFPVLEW
jgi:hypothetical protein